MEANAGMKPSVAGYTMRPDSFALANRYKGEAPLHRANGNDEGLLALIDSQTETAHKRLRQGRAQQAIELLRRAHQAAVTFVAPSPKGEVPLVVRLASATVRLQICAALSLLDRHPQAMEEAILAKDELDTIVLTMSDACNEASALDETGELMSLDATLLSHLKHPPSWLRRAIESAITARMCQAVELEFIMPAEELHMALKSSHSSTFPSIQKHMSADTYLPPDAVGLAKPAFSDGEELAELHRQAKQMCKMLLPQDNVTRNETEKHIKMAQERWKEVLGLGETDTPSMGNWSSPAISKSWSEPSMHATTSLPPLTHQPKWTRPQRLNAGFHDNMLRSSTGSKDSFWTGSKESHVSLESTAYADSSAEPWTDLSTQDSFRSMDSFQSESLANHSDFVLNAPPGDVMYRTMPASFAHAKRESIARRGALRRASTESIHATRAVKASTKESAKAEAAEDPNPFQEWKLNFQDKGKMNYFERELTTLEGIGRLHKNMKSETIHFKHRMVDLERYSDENRLADNRLLYSGHGVKALKMGEKLKKDWAKKNVVKSRRVLEVQAKKRELWSFYGVDHKGFDDAADLKAVTKLMQVSFERSPAEKKRRMSMELHQKQAEEEAMQRRRVSVLSAAGGMFTKHKDLGEHTQAVDSMATLATSGRSGSKTRRQSFQG
mmetsp:Transcript_102983/g.182927  ORF Transcript_102983/g.182927 Transcript_102983/m.182927 type:complete len:668 (-) Transcript_102983:417-2420(-)